MPNNENEKVMSKEDYDKMIETQSALTKAIPELKEALDRSNQIIAEQAETIKELKGGNRKRRIINTEAKVIKDDEREASFILLDIELTKEKEFVYFDDERQKLFNKPKTRHELLVLSIVRSYSIDKGRDESYLILELNCIDVEKKEFNIRIPYKAIGEYSTKIKGRLIKEHKDVEEKKEGEVTKYIKNDEGQVTDEYDVELSKKITSRKFDIRIVTQCSFEGMEFEGVEERNLNLL